MRPLSKRVRKHPPSFYPPRKLTAAFTHRYHEYPMGITAYSLSTALGIALLTASSVLAASGTADLNRPKPLDGTVIEAVETYANPKSSEITLGVGFYPFSGYFNGLSLNGGYTYHSSRTFGWEILNIQSFFSFQKDLTTQLADQYGVNPQAIEELKTIVSSNLVYVHSYGKLVLLQDFIRYFRSSVLAGLGVVNTTTKNSLAGTLGFKFEVFSTESFAWKLEIRDSLALSGFSNYVTFNLGAGFSF